MEKSKTLMDRDLISAEEYAERFRRLCVGYSALCKNDELMEILVGADYIPTDGGLNGKN